MYFGLPSYTPPRLLGETGVRRHWSTKYIFHYIIIRYFRMHMLREDLLILFELLQPKTLAVRFIRISGLRDSWGEQMNVLAPKIN
jgi:hypothetical protein